MKNLSLILIAILGMAITSCSQSGKMITPDRNNVNGVAGPLDSVGNRIIHYKSINLETGASALISYSQPAYLKELVYLAGDTVMVSFQGKIDNECEYSMMHAIEKRLN